MNAEYKPQKKQPLCVGLLAHVDAGKTTLSEAMLYRTGMRRQLGRVDHKDAFLDTHALERERGITIFSKLARMETPLFDLTLVDTPGHVDFSAEAERTMPILDCAILLINGSDGVQAHTLTLWELLERYQIPTFLFVNKMDLPGTEKDSLLTQLQQRLSHNIIDFGADTQTIAEGCAVCDDSALEQYLEHGTVTEDHIREMILSRKLFPCCFGSALKLDGIDQFLRILDTYAPQIPYPSEFSARVYKISRDPQGTRLTWMKITGGALKIRSAISYRDRSGKEISEKCVQIRCYSGAQFTQAEQIPAGYCCAVQGLSATYAGQALGCNAASGDPILEPVMRYRMQLPSGTDPLTLLPKLRQLEEEDPLLHILWDKQQIHLQLMGKVQLASKPSYGTSV